MLGALPFILTLFFENPAKTYIAPSDPPTRVKVSLLENAPSRWIGKKIEICGVEKIVRSGRRVLNDHSGEYVVGVYIAAKLKPSGREAQSTCFTGFWRRIDGKTAEQIATEGGMTISHGYNPEYELSATNG